MKNKKIKQTIKYLLVFAFVGSVLGTGALYAGITQKSTIKTAGSPVTVTMWNNLVKDISNLNLALDGKLSLGAGGNIVASMPTEDNHVATKAYVDAQLNGFPVDSTGCAEGSELTLRWNATANSAEYRCYDVIPATFTFTDKTGQTANTLITSDIIQITGISSSVAVSISGQGSPNFRICSDAACSTVVENWGSVNKNISVNQYLQLRLTSASSASTTYTASVVVGGITDSWSVAN